MSVLRPVRSAQYFDLFEVDTFQLLSVVNATSITNNGTAGLQINISDPNSGADVFQYTYIVQRSVDGSSFSTISRNVTGAIETFQTDIIFFVIGTTVTLADGSVVTFGPTSPTYVTLPTTPSFNPLTVAAQASVLFDTTVFTPAGTEVLASGTIITLPIGASLTAVTAPAGHTYAYQVAAQNKYATTAFGTSASITVSSSFSAQTLNALTRTNNVISLTWTDPNSYATGQQIEVWEEVGVSGYDLLATITKSSGAMPTAYDDAFDFFTLVPATYSYKIRAVSSNPQDTGPFSNAQSIAVSYTLSAPTSLAVGVVTGNGAHLTWIDPNSPSAEAGLYIYRDVGNTSVFTRVATVSPGTLTYFDAFVPIPGQIYTYKVSAFNALHEGPASTAASATATLAIPVITSVTQTADVGAVVAWTDTNTFETAYTLQRSINGGAYATVSAVIPAGSTSYADTFSEPIGTTIAYKIRATNASATGSYSIPFQITLAPQLVSPANVSVVIAGPKEIVVTWKDISPLIRGTSVFKSVNGAALSLVATVAASVTEFDDDFQTVSGAVYAYAVQNFDNQETGPQSNPVAVTTPFDPPQNLHVTASSNNTASLSWTTNNTSMDYTSVETAFADSSVFVEIARVPPGQTSATVTITGGTPGEVVSFRIREVKQPYTILGNVQVPQNLGLYSLVVSTATALSAPFSVAVTRPNPTQNVVTWSDSNTAATGFQVWRSFVGSGPVYSTPLQVGFIDDPTTRSFSDTYPMQVGSTIQYWVYAFNVNNSSPQSNIASLTTRLGLGSVATSQTARTQVTLVMTPPPGYSFVAGDQVQVSRSVNGSTMAVVATVTAFTVPTNYVDNAFTAPANIGALVSYSIRFFSATEAGPDSLTANQALYDAVFMPLGAVNTVRIAGSRNGFATGGVAIFAGCAGGIVKITNDPVTLEPVLLSSSSDYLGTTSIVSGDLTRVVAATSANQMYLINASTLARIVLPIATTSWPSVYNNAGSSNLSVVGQGGNYTGASSGVYKGWSFSTQQVTLNKGVTPWDSSASQWLNGDGSPYSIEPNESFIAMPFVNAPGGSFQPARLENVGGDAVAFVLQQTNSGFTSAYNTTMFQVQRSTNQAIEIFNIADYVLDFTSDSVSKVVAVTISGAIYLIDTSIIPSSAGTSFLGYNPTQVGAVIGTIPVPSVYAQQSPTSPPQGRPGQIITMGVGSISIELGAGQHIATATHNGGPTTINIFVVPAPPVRTNTVLQLIKTYTVNERINGLAFDGGKFFYGRSIDTNKLFRFDAVL